MKIYISSLLHYVCNYTFYISPLHCILKIKYSLWYSQKKKIIIRTKNIFYSKRRGTFVTDDEIF